MHPFLSLLERASMLNSCLVRQSLCGRDGAFIDKEAKENSLFELSTYPATWLDL